MKIQSIRLKNFKAFKDVHLKNLPDFCVFVGANGTGKSTIFSVFEFLQTAMSQNINNALTKLGGPKGFQEVRTRNSTGPIEIEIQYKIDNKPPLITYQLIINELNGKAYVEKELLKYRRGQGGKPWHFLEFEKGEGSAITNEATTQIKEKREKQKLKSPDILAIKGISQFEKFPAAVALGNLIENWHISDIHVDKARNENLFDEARHLARDGSNLSLVLQYLNQHHPSIFEKILNQLKHRIPGLSQIETKITEEGKVLLKFQDGAFTEPFLARFVSDGTIKMLSYLVLLYDPKPHPLLCVEEPENQLYNTLLTELAEEFRLYSMHGGQVFVSSHSPDFLNALELEEVFWLSKKDGSTKILRASEDEQIKQYVKMGDKLGALWRQGFFTGATP